MNKIFTTRAIQKHDSFSNWENNINFIPFQGEIVVYDDLNKVKIGNGINCVKDLPFLSSTVIEENKNNIQRFWKGSLAEYNLLTEKDANFLYMINEGINNLGAYEVKVSTNPPVENNPLVLTCVIGEEVYDNGIT